MGPPKLQEPANFTATISKNSQFLPLVHQYCLLHLSQKTCDQIHVQAAIIEGKLSSDTITYNIVLNHKAQMTD